MVSTKLIAEARRNGISAHLLRVRLSRGWDEVRATTEPAVKKRSYWLGIAKENGISEKLFDQRAYVLGHSFERAATTPVNQNYWKNRKKVKEANS